MLTKCCDFTASGTFNVTKIHLLNVPSPRRILGIIYNFISVSQIPKLSVLFYGMLIVKGLTMLMLSFPAQNRSNMAILLAKRICITAAVRQYKLDVFSHSIALLIALNYYSICEVTTIDNEHLNLRHIHYMDSLITICR